MLIQPYFVKPHKCCYTICCEYKLLLLLLLLILGVRSIEVKVKKETTVFYFCIYIFYFFNFLNFLYSCIFLANFKCLPSFFFGGSFRKPPTCDVDVHVTKTVSSCMNQLVQIGRIKHLLDKKTLWLLINSFVFSKLFFIVPQYGGTHLNVTYTNCSCNKILLPELYKV